ncbi:hypothetical protein ACN20G_19610 [Streptomyces sp. BI20]|uniref:hypothetical protein n=1 Tax=Streptomyces sp. BI20 TaxID=3403460 RepID=UPI003C71031A
MHIPAYARDAIRAVLPRIPTSRHVGMVSCCLCDKPFGEDLAPIPLGPTPTSGLFGCRPCLSRLITKARRDRDAARVRDARNVRDVLASWEAVCERHLARLDEIRRAAEAVAESARGGEVTAVDVAWLLVCLESAHVGVPEAPEPPSVAAADDTGIKDADFRLDLAMIEAREAVAERLTYHVINEAAPADPEACEEFGCPEGCSGHHEMTDIDCGPDAVFEHLAEHGITVEREEWESVPGPGPEAEHEPIFECEDEVRAVLEHAGLDVTDTDVLVSAAAVGLVADAWREGPLCALHAADDGPNDGEIFAQSVDLYRRARAALTAAREEGPDVLLGFAAVASAANLAWAGRSGFALSHMSRSSDEFVRHVDDRVWFTREVIRQDGWYPALLHRAFSAVFKASDHFGMPQWPGVVASAMERMAELDRGDAPPALADPEAVREALLDAPDRLGAEALEWLARKVFV